MLELEEGILSARGSIFKVALLLLILAAPFLEGGGLPKEIKQLLSPYLLPENQPVKPLLDALFGSTRATFSLESMEKAGFSKSSPRKFSKLVVTKHPAIPGYVFKIYLDAQRYHKEQPEYVSWILRIQGAELVRSAIVQAGIESFFKVPKKWIYILPNHPKPNLSYYPKFTILVEEDMEILSKQENKDLWASNYVTEQLLDHLYFLLKNVGLYDCAKPDNIPFSRDGRVSFIDTETFGKNNVSYENLCNFLSKPNKIYWEKLTDCK